MNVAATCHPLPLSLFNIPIPLFLPVRVRLQPIRLGNRALLLTNLSFSFHQNR